MPPRYAYWTILIDNGPTAFRAAKREDLQPTFVQLQRTNPNIIVKWFARGRLWDSPEAEREAQRKPTFSEKRGPDWRPGGQHKDPRARFDKRKTDHRPRRDRDQPGKPLGVRRDFRPAGDRPAGKPSGVGRDFSPAGGKKPFRPAGSRKFRPCPPRDRRK